MAAATLTSTSDSDFLSCCLSSSSGCSPWQETGRHPQGHPGDPAGKSPSPGVMPGGRSSSDPPRHLRRWTAPSGAAGPPPPPCSAASACNGSTGEELGTGSCQLPPASPAQPHPRWGPTPMRPPSRSWHAHNHPAPATAPHPAAPRCGPGRACAPRSAPPAPGSAAPAAPAPAAPAPCVPARTAAGHPGPFSAPPPYAIPPLSRGRWGGGEGRGRSPAHQRLTPILGAHRLPPAPSPTLACSQNCSRLSRFISTVASVFW